MSRVFTTASDESQIALIETATNRLAVIAPGLTTPVAIALAGRMADLPSLALTVVLDADPEVYRMGYGDPEALEIIREASRNELFDLREQPGVRIGVIISDDRTMVFAPVSRNVEAGSTTEEKPNAIILDGRATEKLAVATGAAEGESEVGNLALEPARVARMTADLRQNPPKPFNLTRQLRVFTAAAEFVELRVSNYQISKRRVSLPKEFITIGDITLRDRISSQIRAPFDEVKPQKIKIESDGLIEELEVDQNFIEKERREIEDYFTYIIPKKGRVILKRDRSDFDKQIERFEKIVKKFSDSVKISIQSAREGFKKQMLEEFSEQWKLSPPSFLSRRSGINDSKKMEEQILLRADRLFSDIVNFTPPEVTVNYKGIVIEDIENNEFRSMLHNAMERAGVDRDTLDKLFELGDVAAAKGNFEK